MSHNFSLKQYENRVFIILMIIIFGFISSKALISIGTAALFLNFILSYKSHQLFFVKKSDLPILSASLFFLFSFLFLFIAPSFNDALSQIWVRLPWLVIPFSLAAIKNYKNQHIYLLISFLIFITTISAFIVLFNYFINYEFYQHKISIGQHIPTPINHIRFSLLMAFSGISSIYFAIKNNTRLTPYDRLFFIFTSIFIFISLHIFAIRSGLATYYIALLFLCLYFTFHFKKWWIIPTVLILSSISPYLAYKNIQSFKNKIDYMMYDIQQIQNGTYGHNADARRYRALEITKDLLNEKIILGYGLGNVKNTFTDYYQTHLPDVETKNQKIPHNQFVYTSLEMGLIGLFILLVSLFLPLFSNLWFKNPLYVSFWLIIVASCMVENTLEGQLGLTYYLVFASLLLKLNPNE